MTSKIKTKNETTQVWNFRGKYATYMRDLLGEAAPYQKIFDQIYHGYVFCGLYGLIKGARHTYDSVLDNPGKTDVVGFRWAYADNGGLYSYDNLRKMVLLFDKSSNVSFTDKVDNALRFDYSTNDVTDEGLIEQSRYGINSELIDEYVLGGLDLIHSKVMKTTSSQAMIVLLDEIILEVQQELDRKKKELEAGQ